MPQGVPIDEDTVARFEALYLLSGNAAACGRKLGISASTAAGIAARLSKDPLFKKAREELRAQYLDELVMQRQRIAHLAATRAMRKTADTYEGITGPTVVDNRPAYMRIVLDAEKNAHALAKLEVAAHEQNGPAVIINLSGGAELEADEGQVEVKDKPN